MEEDIDLNDEGIPFFLKDGTNNNINSNNRVILDENDDIVVKQIEKQPCKKECCGNKKEQQQQQQPQQNSVTTSLLLKNDRYEDNDEGIIIYNSSNVGSIVSLDDNDGGDIVMFSKNKTNENNYKKGCCPTSKELETTAPIIIKSDDSDCKKSCCPASKQLKEKTAPVIIKFDDNGCKKGCCPTLSKQNEVTTTSTASTTPKITKSDDNGCKKNCCPTSPPENVETTTIPIKDGCKGKESSCCKPNENKSTIVTTKTSTKTYCCEICVPGHCCKKDCCKQLCCLTYSLNIPNFSFINDGNQQTKKKRIFASMFSKACGTFGFKVGYNELNDGGDNDVQKQQTTSNGDNVSIELLPSDDGGKQFLFLIVSGMTCADCVATMEDKLKSLDGVFDISTNLFTGKCKINYSPTILLPSEIISIIESIGFTAKQDRDQSSNSSTNQITIEIISNNNNDHSFVQQSDLIDQIKNSSIDGIIDVTSEVITNNESSFNSFAAVGDNKILIVHDIQIIGPRNLFNQIQNLLNSKFNVKVELSSDKSSSGSGGKSTNHQTLKPLLLLCILLFFPTIIISYIVPYIKGIDKIFEYQVINQQISLSTLLLWLFATPIQFYVGKPLYISAWKTLVYGKKCSMDLLVMTSSTIAYFYSLINVFTNIGYPSYNGPIFFETCVILLSLIILGRYLEQLAKSRASNVLIEKMKGLGSSTAILLESTNDNDEYVGGGVGEQELIIEKELIEKGDLLKVLPYSKIPIDGIIVRGNGYIDESIITGESNQVFKDIDDVVYGGSMNQKSCLVIRVTKHSNDTTLSNIIKLVEQGQSIKPNSQNIADMVASYFVPSILLLSIVSFVIWFCLIHFGVVFLDHDKSSSSSSAFTFSIKIAMSVMVISCPCAISLATPTYIMVGSGVGAKNGILFKGGKVIESTSKIDTIVFDKTGTLTTGEIKVNHFSIYDLKLSPKELFFFAASAELSSEHLIGKSIKKHAIEQLNIPSSSLQEPITSEIHPGKGIISIVNNKKVIVGNKSFIDSIIGGCDNNNHHIEKDIDKFESLGKTVIIVSIDDIIVGLISLSDTLKPEAKKVISKLKSNGINVWLVSGDNKKATQSIGNELNIDSNKIIGSALPMDKFNIIKELQQHSGNNNSSSSIVAMVGDGINDSLALVQSDVGVSFSCGGGTDIAIESAEIILLKNDLNDILVSIDLSKSIFNTIKFNLWWAFIYNLIGIPLSSGMLYPFFNFTIPPALAGISELLSSLPVVLFSLTLNQYKYKNID